MELNLGVGYGICADPKLGTTVESLHGKLKYQEGESVWALESQL